MDKMSQKEMEALFSKMIGNMKAYAQKNEERIDKQLWQPVKEPLLLKNAIMMRTKYDIDEIRQAYMGSRHPHGGNFCVKAVS